MRASFLAVVLTPPMEWGPRSATSTVIVFENTAKQKSVSKQMSFWWRERTLPLPFALFWRSNRWKYTGCLKKYWFSEALDIDFTWMLIASIKLLTRMMDGCLILNKLGWRRVKLCLRVMITLQCWLLKCEHFYQIFPVPSQLCAS